MREGFVGASWDTESAGNTSDGASEGASESALFRGGGGGIIGGALGIFGAFDAFAAFALVPTTMSGWSVPRVRRTASRTV